MKLLALSSTVSAADCSSTHWDKISPSQMDTPTLALTHGRSPNSVVGQEMKSRRKKKYKTHICGFTTREQPKSNTACSTAVAELLTTLQKCGNFAEILPVSRPRMDCNEEAVSALPQLCGQKGPGVGAEVAAPKAPTRSRCVRKHMRKRANKRARKEAAHVLVGLAANAEKVAVQSEVPGCVHNDPAPALVSSAECHTEPVTLQAPAPTAPSILVSARNRSALGKTRPHHIRRL
ncbi:hypothetical protein EV426DRAFT_389220 [Tirmania nivea]|nr:hypothetical protein EV426DRAFT_389220 [Tirmania nivea]